MTLVFADASYWIALASPKDQSHRSAIEASKTLVNRRIVTTDEVLAELLSFFADYGVKGRAVAVEFVEKIISNSNIHIEAQTRESFRAGLAFYKNRPDKGYGMTDCISMSTMRRLNINEVLTADRHFKQDGFTCLMQPPDRES
ncbi:MAG: PIN domain-containing protein [Planctomycetota bacterium]